MGSLQTYYFLKRLFNLKIISLSAWKQLEENRKASLSNYHEEPLVGTGEVAVFKKKKKNTRSGGEL